MADRKSALRIQDGVPQPPNINPAVLSASSGRKRRHYSAGEFTDGILNGNRTILSQAITLLESSLPEHYDTAQKIIDSCLPHSGKSVRIGITGVPGAGKSTFIETLGLHIVSGGKKLAVLAIDPSSGRTMGSILGDKTRMEQLSIHPNAFIRPSPSAGTLGGVARKTRETIILCEAAGFDTIIVETVGVGQSETAVNSMVDFFLLVMLSGAGDELQGIKRGILEMADMIAVNKADGSNRINAEATKVLVENTLRLFPGKTKDWKPRVRICSALTDWGIREIREVIYEYISITRSTGYFEENRRQQAVVRMHDAVCDHLANSFYSSNVVKELLPELESMLRQGKITSYRAALNLIDTYFNQ